VFLDEGVRSTPRKRGELGGGSLKKGKPSAWWKTKVGTGVTGSSEICKEREGSSKIPGAQKVKKKAVRAGD